MCVCPVRHLHLSCGMSIKGNRFLCEVPQVDRIPHLTPSMYLKRLQNSKPTVLNYDYSHRAWNEHSLGETPLTHLLRLLSEHCAFFRNYIFLHTNR